MLDTDTISGYVDRMAEIKSKVDILKAEYSDIEAELLKQFEVDVEDTKYKTVVYSGRNAKVTTTYADSVKLVYPSFLRKIFGEAYKDVVTEETTYKLSASAKRMLAALYNGEYLKDITIDEAINELEIDDKAKTVLLKRIKGKSFDTDRKNLISVGGLDEAAASDMAYMISEAAAWQSFLQLLSITGNISQERIAETLNYIDSAVTVEETPKITVEIN